MSAEIVVWTIRGLRSIALSLRMYPYCPRHLIWAVRYTFTIVPNHSVLIGIAFCWRMRADLSGFEMLG